MTSEQAVPDMALADYINVLRNPLQSSQHAEAAQSLSREIESRKLGALYQYAGEELQLIPFDKSKHAEFQKANDELSTKLQSGIEEASQAEDEGAVVEAWLSLANHYTAVLDRSKALETLQKTAEMTASVGAKIDIVLTIIRIGYFFTDKVLIARELATAEGLIERGGDWERKNKFKTYKGLYLMSIRNFDEAAQLLLDSFATFTCTELLSYAAMVGFGVLCGAISLSRTDLKRRVVDSPELLSLLPTTKSLEPLSILTNSLYTGEYSTFLQALADVEVLNLKPSWLLASHSAFYVREMRRKAYTQLLDSYMALSLKSMADTFGVSVDYLETDLARLIPQKKLNCVVDRVNGVVITNRLDTKNAQYQQLVQEGDALLTKLQKYGAAVRLYGADEL